MGRHPSHFPRRSFRFFFFRGNGIPRSMILVSCWSFRVDGSAERQQKHPHFIRTPSCTFRPHRCGGFEEHRFLWKCAGKEQRNRKSPLSLTVSERNFSWIKYIDGRIMKVGCRSISLGKPCSWLLTEQSDLQRELMRLRTSWTIFNEANVSYLYIKKIQ